VCRRVTANPVWLVKFPAVGAGGPLNGRQWHRVGSPGLPALIVALGGSRFSWGGASLAEPGEARLAYISALHTADATGDLGPLTTFARS
jgi:hypothetical protein